MGKVDHLDEAVVSVILATNRGGPYLEETLKSLSSQSFQKWELIVIDDGSEEPDALRELVAPIGNGRVIRQDNAGISVARNVGFAHSSGEFIAYLDDDDLWQPEKLQQQVTALRQNPSAASCHSGYFLIDRNGDRFGHEVRAETASARDYLNGSKDIPRSNTLLVRRSVVERMGGFLSGLSLYEDCEFVLRVVQEGPVVSLPEQLVSWRRYSESVSFSKSAQVMDAAAIHAVTMARWAAETRGDHETARQLSINARRVRRRLAEPHAREFCHRVRKMELAPALAELGQGLRCSPLWVVLTCLRSVYRSAY